MASLDQVRSFSRPSFLADLMAQLRAVAERRATARALGALSDRELGDLGLERADIADIAAGRRPAHRV